MNSFITIEKNDIYSYETNDKQVPVLCVAKHLSGFQHMLCFYNEHGDIFLERFLGLDDELLYENEYQYCYDECGNKTGKIQLYHGYAPDYVRKCEPYVKKYINVLDSSSHLIDVTCKTQDENICYRKLFDYKDDLIMRMQLQDGNSPISIIYENTYDEDNHLIRTKISSSDSIILYWIHYIHLSSNIYQYCKTSPTGSSFCWWIASYQNEDVSIVVKEPVLTEELLNEILDFALEQFSFVSDIIIDVQECDIGKWASEIQELIDEFTSCNHIEVSFDF